MIVPLLKCKFVLTLTEPGVLYMKSLVESRGPCICERRRSAMTELRRVTSARRVARRWSVLPPRDGSRDIKPGIIRLLLKKIFKDDQSYGSRQHTQYDNWIFLRFEWRFHGESHPIVGMTNRVNSSWSLIKKEDLPNKQRLNRCANYAYSSCLMQDFACEALWMPPESSTYLDLSYITFFEEAEL